MVERANNITRVVRVVTLRVEVAAAVAAAALALLSFYLRMIKILFSYPLYRNNKYHKNANTKIFVHSVEIMKILCSVSRKF